MSDALIGIVGAVIGAVATVALTAWRDNRQQRQQAAAVKNLLRAEINLNLRELRRLLETPVDVVSLDGYLPSFSHQIWESQLQAVGNALSIDEIEKVHAFYYGLENLQHQPHIDLAHPIGVAKPQLVDFPDELKDAVTKLVSKGNPLEPPGTR